MDTNHQVASAYWHWHFHSQPEPFPERLIGNDPDFLYETCLIGWSASRLEDFDPGMIHGSCPDYRAAKTIDLEHDAADIDRKAACPTLVLYGSAGVMARLFGIPAEWRKRCENVFEAALPDGHFFVDRFPEETASLLIDFIDKS